MERSQKIGLILVIALTCINGGLCMQDGRGTYAEDINQQALQQGQAQAAASSGANQVADIEGVLRTPAGFLDDGTPFFKKIIPFTITAGNATTASPVVHNIPNAYSRKRIIDIRSFGDAPGGVYMIGEGNFSDTIILAHTYTNINVSPTRGNTVTTVNFYMVITYI